MPQKTVWLSEVGELVLSKRKGSKNLRLSINAAGRVRIGLPIWAPYSLGISFAKSRAGWINEHKGSHPEAQLKNGARIGKSYRLHYVFNKTAVRTSTRLVGSSVRVVSNLPLSDAGVQKVIVSATERALKKEAGVLLPQKLASLAVKHGFTYKTVRIKKLSSRWGSCSSDKTITLNYFLMQLPWQLIDYVLIHELIHTKHLNHSPSFWKEFEKMIPGAKKLSKEIKKFRPIINSLGQL